MRVAEQVVDATKFLQQFDRCFFAYTGTTGNVIATVAHKSQQINYLQLVFESVFCRYFCNTHYLVPAVVSRTVHKNMFVYQLAVIFIGCQHKYLKSFGGGLFCHGSNHIVRLKPFYLKNRNAIRIQYLFYNGHRKPNIFWRLLSSCLVGIVCFVSESRSGRVKSNPDMGGLFAL